MRKVVVAVDSFKGSLTSEEVAEAFAGGFRTIFPQCEICKVAVEVVPDLIIVVRRFIENQAYHHSERW